MIDNVAALLKLALRLHISNIRAFMSSPPTPPTALDVLVAWEQSDMARRYSMAGKSVKYPHYRPQDKARKQRDLFLVILNRQARGGVSGRRTLVQAQPVCLLMYQ